MLFISLYNHLNAYLKEDEYLTERKRNRIRRKKNLSL